LVTTSASCITEAKPPVRRARKADTISETGVDEDRVESAAGVGGAGRSGGDSAGKGSAGGSRAGGTVDGGGTVRPPRQTTSKYKRS
jgi:hypothetical protein